MVWSGVGAQKMGKGAPAQKGWQKSSQKGWQKGSGKGEQQSKPPVSVPQDFEVDADARYSGTVAGFFKFKGYGFINLDQKGLVPDDKIFVYWKNIKSDDRFPALMKDTQVEFGLLKLRNPAVNGEFCVAAKCVTLPGGGSIAVQDEADSKKTFIGGQDLRYTGTLKFFDPRGGYGYIKIDEGYALDGVPQELRVETAEVNAAGKQPRHMKDMSVEFGIWQNVKGTHKAYNMTLPGGLPMTCEALENREMLGSWSYTGTIVIWNFRQMWGYITPDPSTTFPPQVQAKLTQMQEDTKQKGKTVEHEKAIYFRRSDCQQGYKAQKGASVTFNIYTDDKGVGACDVH